MENILKYAYLKKYSTFWDHYFVCLGYHDYERNF